MTTDTLLIALMLSVLVFELGTRAFITRRIIREVMLVITLMEVGTLNLVKWIYPPKYVVTGSCDMRGVCCTMIVGDPPRFIKNRRWLIGLFVGFHRVAHNFHVVARGDDDEVIFSCGYLRDDGRCGIYRHRPFICRNYPVVPFFSPPRPLPGCGFGVAPRVVAASAATQRPSLRILNAQVSVHHPTRLGGRQRLETPDDFERVDLG